MIHPQIAESGVFAIQHLFRFNLYNLIHTNKGQTMAQLMQLEFQTHKATTTITCVRKIACAAGETLLGHIVVGGTFWPVRAMSFITPAEIRQIAAKCTEMEQA